MAMSRSASRLSKKVIDCLSLLERMAGEQTDCDYHQGRLSPQLPQG
jgi:hypothetical protein